MIDLDALTDDELDELARAVSRQQHARSLGKQIHEVNVTARMLADDHRGDAWTQPQGAHDAYPAGWTVEHAGAEWVSLIDGNVWEPGETGWRQVTADGPPRWVQPLGAHDAYPEGYLVEHDGEVYESLVPHNVWHPQGQQWRLWEPEDPEEGEEDPEGENGDDTGAGEPDEGPEPWAEGVDYAPGDRVLYEGATYVCVQPHTSQAGWTPAAVPALWSQED